MLAGCHSFIHSFELHGFELNDDDGGGDDDDDDVEHVDDVVDDADGDVNDDAIGDGDGDGLMCTAVFEVLLFHIKYPVF